MDYTYDQLIIYKEIVGLLLIIAGIGLPTFFWFWSKPAILGGKPEGSQ